MRKIVVMAVMAFLSLSSFAQGIEFEHGTFAEALAKAKKENKLLFVDYYTTWCGPCKMMSKNIFPKDEVGKYFNEKFISLKMDAEKGEGPDLAKKYKVSGYPTMIYFDSEGKEIKRLTGATSSIEAFLSFTKEVLGEEMSWEKKYQEYEKGNRDLDFVRDLLTGAEAYVSSLPNDETEKWLEKLNEISEWYFNNKQPSQMVNKKDFAVIKSYLGGAKNEHPIVEYVYDNYEAYKKVVPVDDLSVYVVMGNNQSIYKSAQENTKFRKYYADIKGRLAQPYIDADAGNAYEEISTESESVHSLFVDKDVDSYLDYREKLIVIIEKGNEGVGVMNYALVPSLCLNTAKEYTSEKQMKRVIEFAKRGFDLSSKDVYLHIVLGDCYLFLGNKIEAENFYNKANKFNEEKKNKYFQKTISEKMQALK